MHSQQIDRNIPVPMFYQLKNILLDFIETGRYQEGDMIPTEAELSEQYGVSRTTVRQAVLELVQQGYLHRTKGKGTFVSKSKIVHSSFIQKIESFYDEIIRMGMVPSTEVLACEAVVPPEVVASMMGLQHGQKAIFLYRKRFADGEPVVTIKTYLPLDSCGFILNHNMQENRLYKLLETNPETEICHLIRRIEATEADDVDNLHLQIPVGKPIHFFTTTGYAKNGKVIEYSLARYRGDRNRFSVHIELVK